MHAAELSQDARAVATAAGEASKDVLWPGARNRLVSAFLAWRVRSGFRRSFHAVRAANGTLEHLRAMDADPRPAIALVSHSSWWDPLIGLILARRSVPHRAPIGPMQFDQLRRFKILRRLGMFGIDPNDPKSLPAMVEYVRSELRREPKTMLWITPQGEFADVRSAVRLRPGAAAVATALGNVRVVSIASELAFWTDKRPEVFVRIAPVEPDATTLSGWQRAMQGAMQANADDLAKLVIARDPGAFEVLMGGRTAAVHPVYDLWLRLTGRGTQIDAIRRTEKRS